MKHRNVRKIDLTRAVNFDKLTGHPLLANKSMKSVTWSCVHGRFSVSEMRSLVELLPY